MEYSLKSCQVYTKEKELSNEELDELKMMKEGLQSLYEESPLAEQQDFEVWYQEEIKQ